ncbi:hypothetical protein KIN20_002162 [Parelaphostrongylus tenuis]|uniref:Uncharacterized protein n=1 Tax=Parelaphostrongylus tenuis TaxID=148309 RepID=A0AAD5QF40_PARTN|nr:hypothetical protein KIN20_002162 [Parelaphostrongylus tenuis]
MCGCMPIQVEMLMCASTFMDAGLSSGSADIEKIVVRIRHPFYASFPVPPYHHASVVRRSSRLNALRLHATKRICTADVAFTFMLFHSCIFAHNGALLSPLSFTSTTNGDLCPKVVAWTYGFWNFDLVGVRAFCYS